MSNKFLSYTFIFSLGAAAGAVVAWRACKTKYEQIAREEIASVKEVFSERLHKLAKSEEDKNEEPVSEDTEAEVTRHYNEISSRYGGDRKEEKVDKPYVISPDEFGEEEEYECVSLTYYADGVLTDEVDEMIDDVENLIGRDSLNHFGEYEDDSVFVRDDAHKCYYEILRDSRNYSDVCGR